jgi:hypothetical protein
LYPWRTFVNVVRKWRLGRIAGPPLVTGRINQEEREKKTAKPPVAVLLAEKTCELPLVPGIGSRGFVHPSDQKVMIKNYWEWTPRSETPMNRNT